MGDDYAFVLWGVHTCVTRFRARQWKRELDTWGFFSVGMLREDTDLVLRQLRR